MSFFEIGIESQKFILDLSESFQFSCAGSRDVLNDVGRVAEKCNTLEERRKEYQAPYGAKKRVT
jgi:hypothetical protein